MAWVLPGFSRCVHELRAPEMADRQAVAVEYIEHRHWCFVGVLPTVVAAIGVGVAGDEVEVAPAALASERQQVWQRRPGCDDEVDQRSGMRRGAVPLVQQRGARWARAVL